MEKTSTDIGKLFLALIVVAALTANVSCGSIEAKRMQDDNMSNLPLSRLIEDIVGHKDLNYFFHPDIAGRTPLIVETNNLLPETLNVEAFGEPAKLVENSSNEATLRIVTFKESGNGVDFVLHYDIEGVLVDGKAEYTNGKWHFSEFNVYER